MHQLNEHTKIFHLLISLFFLLNLNLGEELCNPQDKIALLQFKKQLGNSSSLSTWNSSTDCCTDWTFERFEFIIVNCDANGRVIELTIDAAENVSTKIPRALGNLTSLETLKLYNLPNLHGHIPGSSICKLKNLVSLTIAFTNMSGPIPNCLGQLERLMYIDLTGIGLTGKIPPSLVQLPNLEQIYLGYNNLRGPIPQFSPQNKAIFLIHLTNNKLSGRIPTSLGLLSNLTELSLANNQLKGPLLAAFGLISTLRWFDLSNNHFIGPIPDTFGSLTNSITLLLNDNNLTGPLPKSLAQLIPTWLDLSNNRFTGDASILFGYDRGWIERIIINNNRFEFNLSNVIIPESMTILYSFLNISHNHIYGTLPKDLGKVRFVDVSYNQLCGAIPSGCDQFGASSFEHNKCLCGAPLTACN